jgi:hypothetical protein
MLSLSHANRITRPAPHVQLASIDTSTCSSVIPPSAIAPSLICVVTFLCRPERRLPESRDPGFTNARVRWRAIRNPHRQPLSRSAAACQWHLP